MIRVRNDYRVDKLIRALPREDSARITSIVGLFSEQGFNLSSLYLKKLTSKVWELRSGSWRVLFGMIGEEAAVVNIFRKKTQKTPVKEIDLAERRLRTYS